MIKTVLTIAGSDPTGGAGIQADLKTMTVLGVYGAAVISCITVQNSRGVTRVEPLHPVLVGEQIEAVLTDHQVTHVKIGMVGTAGIARVIARRLLDFRGEVIYDPVLLATTGQQLMVADDLEKVRAELLPRITVLTPNLPELEALTGMTVRDRDEIRAAVATLFQNSERLRAVLVKGGHGDASTMVTDTLFRITNGELAREELSHAFQQTGNSHGTGCTLASAFAAYHAQGGDYSKAFRQAVFLVQKLLRQGTGERVVNNPKGKGGLPHHLACAQAAD